MKVRAFAMSLLSQAVKEHGAAQAAIKKDNGEDCAACCAACCAATLI